MLSKKDAQKIIDTILKDKVLYLKKASRGMVNETYFVKLKHDDDIVIRLFKKESWKANKEEYIYNLMRKIVPVPDVLKVDTSRKIIPYAYSVMTKIKGIELDKAYKIHKDSSIPRKAGEALAKIHSIRFDKYGWIVNRQIKPMFNTWQDFVSYDFNQKLNKVKKIKAFPKALVKKSIDYFNENKSLLNITKKPCLLHKDYHCSHILFDKKRLSGIIDVEWALAGHNELDLIKSEWWICESIPDLKKPFLDGYKRYGSISRHYPQRKALYELVLSIGLAYFSYKMKSKYWLDNNIQKIKGIVENA